MDALILNAGHSQLEEQLKIAAACGVAERQASDIPDGSCVGQPIEENSDENNDGTRK